MQTLKTWQRVLWSCGFLWLLTLSSVAQTVDTNAPQTFEQVKVLLLQDGKTREIPARLRFTGTEVVIEDASGKVLLTAANDEVKAAEYAYSKHRRWQTGAIAGGAVSAGIGLAYAQAYPAAAVLLGVGFIIAPVGWVLHHTFSKRHWLTLRTGKDIVILRLDKRTYKSVITTLENHTKLTVAWQGER